MKIIPIEAEYPSGGMKERRARSFALGGGSEACPDLHSGFFLDVLDTFSSRKKYQNLIAKGKNKFSPNDKIYLEFLPLIAARA
jgi:hypothetical protein